MKCKYCRKRDFVQDKAGLVCTNCGCARLGHIEDEFKTPETPFYEKPKVHLTGVAEYHGIDLSLVMDKVNQLKFNKETETAVVYVTSLLQHNPVFLGDFGHSINMHQFRKSVKDFEKLVKCPSFDEMVRMMTMKLLRERGWEKYGLVAKFMIENWKEQKKERCAEIVAVGIVCALARALNVNLCYSKLGYRVGVSPSSITQVMKELVGRKKLKRIVSDLNDTSDTSSLVK